MHLMFTQYLQSLLSVLATTLTASNMNAMRLRPYDQQLRTSCMTMHEYGISCDPTPLYFLVYFAFLLSDDVSNPCFRF